MKKKALKRKKHLITNEMMSLRLPNDELVADARLERKNMLSDMNTFLVEQIDNDYKYANVKKPFDRLRFRTIDNAFESDLEVDAQFRSHFERLDLSQKVKVENFKENTRQWELAYDPFKSEQMLQIYGTKQP